MWWWDRRESINGVFSFFHFMFTLGSAHIGLHRSYPLLHALHCTSALEEVFNPFKREHEIGIPTGTQY